MKSLNPPTSAKPVMTKLQNLFVALVNMDTFQMTLKLRLFTVKFLSNLCYNIVSTLLCLQTCRMFADVCSVYTIKLSLKFSVNLNLRTAGLPTPDVVRLCAVSQDM